MYSDFTMNYLFTVLTHSKKSLVLFSFLSSFSMTYVLEKIYANIETHDTLIPLSALIGLVLIINGFMAVDFITGIVASRTKGKGITSLQWGATISKSFSVFLYMVLSVFLILAMPESYIVMTIVFCPLILVLLKEYISIGENLYKIYGKKSYIFNVMDKLFDLIELRFFRIFARQADKLEDLIKEEEEKSEEKKEETKEEKS